MSSFGLILVALTVRLLDLPTKSHAEVPQVAQVIVQQQQQQQQQQHQAFRYGVIVDCGSSGTRAHIFRWPATDQDADLQLSSVEDLPTTIEQLKDPKTNKPLIERIKPGLSSLRDNPDLASDYMRPIMDFLSANVPAEAQPRTPIFFLGTAGLRLLEHSIQKRILDDIARDLPRTYPSFQNLFTRVISGLEEGFYQWLSVNTFANRLAASYDPKPAREFQCQAPRARRFGLLEMGGASVQISFELSDELDQPIRRRLQSDPLALRAYEQSQVEFQLSPTKKRRIFSATFLGFGSNNARNLAISLLIREAGSRLIAATTPHRRLAPILYGGPNATLLIEDPCLPVGAQETHGQRSFMSLFDQTRPIDYDEAHDHDQDDDNESSFTVRLYGGGSFAQCQRLLNRVLVASKRELINCYQDTKDGESAELTPCTTHLLGRDFVPFRWFQFLGLGDFFYTTDLMLQQSGQFELGPILRRLVGICSSPYRVLKALYPEANREDASRVRQECFKATWMLTLLQVGFRMPAGSDFRTVSEINGHPLDWTTGAMIVRLFDAKNHLDRVQSSAELV